MYMQDRIEAAKRKQRSTRKRGDVLRQASADTFGESTATTTTTTTTNSLLGGQHDDESSRAGAAAYWKQLWRAGVPPGAVFDTAGEPCRALAAYYAERDPAPLKAKSALVPGCGRGYDTAALATYGFGRVVGLDLSEAAIAAATAWRDEALPEEHVARMAVELRAGDFFALSPDVELFDVIFDCTFLCALHPLAREKWAAHVAALTPADGQVNALVFPIARGVGARVVQFFRWYVAGPPYSISVEEVAALLAPHGFVQTYVLDPLPSEIAHLADNPIPSESAFAVFKKQPPAADAAV